MVEGVLEAEATEVLGGGHYECGRPHRGYCNGDRLGRGEVGRGGNGIRRAAGCGRGRAVSLAHSRADLRPRGGAGGGWPLRCTRGGFRYVTSSKRFTDESGRCALTKTAAGELTERLQSAVGPGAGDQGGHGQLPGRPPRPQKPWTCRFDSGGHRWRPGACSRLRRGVSHKPSAKVPCAQDATKPAKQGARGG